MQEVVTGTCSSVRGRLRHLQGCAAAQPPQSVRCQRPQPYGLARKDLGGCRSTCALSHTLQQHGVLVAIRNVTVLSQEVESEPQLSMLHCIHTCLAAFNAQHFTSLQHRLLLLLHGMQSDIVS